MQHGFYTYSTSQFGLDTFQVLGSHMWPMATVLASTDLDQGLADYGQWPKSDLLPDCV